jgi:hypothetical protein
MRFEPAAHDCRLAAPIQETPMNLHRLPALKALCCASLLCCAMQSHAQTSPYYLGVSETVTHDSNLERARTGAPSLSDTYLATGVRLGMDQTISRQRLTANLNANRNQFRNQKRFDNTDYALTTRLDWDTAERLSGSLAAESRQSLDRYDVDNTGTFDGKNLVRSHTVSAQARIGLVTMYTFDGGLSANRVNYEATPRRDVRQWTGNGGISVRPGSGLQVRVGARYTDASYPNYSTGAGDGVKRRDLDFTGTIEASGASTLTARLSRTRETHSAQLVRDNNTWTGALAWNWHPTGKLSLDTTLSRDSNIGSSSFDIGALTFDTSDTRLRTTLALRAQWELTGKVLLGAGASTSRRTLDNSLSTIIGSSVSSASDRTQAWDLSVRYLPTRNVELGCGVHWEDRSVSDPNSTITYAYDVTVLNCSGQLYWR